MQIKMKRWKPQIFKTEERWRDFQNILSLLLKGRTDVALISKDINLINQ